MPAPARESAWGAHTQGDLGGAETTGPRIVVFDVGVVDLDGRSLRVRAPFPTVTGEAARAQAGGH